ncbi:MAG: winged helix-turn-helix domain-containing protein [Bacteroidales bacterium]|nr:winged helix-turn-helix domain-containing protein [Bacteroidales bacterium]
MITQQIGENAGKIWKVIDENGVMDIPGLTKETNLDEQQILLAIGWLSREGKICHFNIDNNWKVQLIY